jgi:hypothetical protein
VLSELVERGWTRVGAAFSAEDASAMRDVVWTAMKTMHGVDRDDRSTWVHEAPFHLDVLKGDPVWHRVGTERLRSAITEALGTAAWQVNKGWGAQFHLFPPIPPRPFDVAVGSWHCDSPYDLPVEPVESVQVITIFGDVAPRAGGMQLVEGSHRVIERVMAGDDAPVKHAARRKMIMRSHPFFVELASPGDPEERAARFMERGDEIDGLPVRVVELSGEAGDVFLVHPRTLHCRPTNAGTEPRFMLSALARKVRT